MVLSINRKRRCGCRCDRGIGVRLWEEVRGRAVCVGQSNFGHDDWCEMIMDKL
jgi:hypothetical protein